MPRRSLPVLEVRAESIDESGAGVSPSTSGPVIVPGLLPGERARVRVVHRSPHPPHRAFAEIVRRHDAAEERVIPACAGYGRCGGCTLQHMAYAAQLAFKRRVLCEALARRGLSPREPVPPCFPAEEGAGPLPALGQRSRVKLVAGVKDGRLVLGAYAPRSHDLVDMAGCRIMTPALAEARIALCGLLGELGIPAYDERTRAGLLRHVLLRETCRGEVQASLVFARLPDDAVLAHAAARLPARAAHVTSVVAHQNSHPGNVILPPEDPARPDRVILGEAALWERIGAVEVRLSPRSFQQVNRPVAARLYEDTRRALAPRGDDVLMDLYCGVGAVGLTAALAAPGLRLLGIEENASAIADARAAALRAGLTTARFVLADAAAAVAPVPMDEARGATLLVVNPPRGGLGEGVAAHLSRHGARTLAYISCDPDTLCRDLLALVMEGYVLRRAAPYDMHPHTPHVEVLAVLERP